MTAVATPAVSRQASSSARPKARRFEARVTDAQKRLLEHAADLKGTTVTDFVVNSAVKAARRTIRESHIIELTKQESEAFVNAVLNPPAPSQGLQAAARRYERWVNREK